MKRSGKTSDVSALLLAAMLAVLAGGGFAVFRALRSDPVEEALAKKEAINILFVLEGAQDEKPLGAYVLMYSPGNNRAVAVSVPGDIGMKLSTVDRVDRIDAVYNPRNITAFMKEIESFLELDIGYSITIEREKLGKIVDLIEGVELFIPQSFEIYDDPPILFPSGNILLDGDKAKQYVSFEIPEEDRRQPYLRRERFFLGLLKSLGEKNGVIQNSQAADAFYPLLKSKMSRRSRERLFGALASLDTSRIGIQNVAGSYQEVSGQEMLLPADNGTMIKRSVQQTRRILSLENPGALIERVFTVEILNGTKTAGLASRTAELIRNFRYEVISTGNAPGGAVSGEEYENTEIIDRTGLQDVVNTFAAIINCKNLRYEPGDAELELNTGGRASTYRADFTLILGRDFNGRVVTGN